jgi:hypothetical protein
MDAMQKRKAWKVIAYHFGFTVFFIIVSLLLPNRIIPDFTNPLEFIRFMSGQFLYLLQPIVFQFVHSETGAEIIIPIWSICFGWIFVKSLNWLNHFQVLGKKVF